MAKLSELVPGVGKLLRECGGWWNESKKLTQSEIEKLLSCIDPKSLEIHDKIVKNNGWEDCPSLASIFLKQPEDDEVYGFSNYGEDNKDSPLHYESNWVHYYVAVLFKKGCIKNWKWILHNQEVLTPEKYFVVNSKGRYFFSKTPITSNVELWNLVSCKIVRKKIN